MPKKHKIKAGKCEQCNEEIRGAFIVFVCQIHAICFVCTQDNDQHMDDWNDGFCCYCQQAVEGAVGGTSHSETTQPPRPEVLLEKGPKKATSKKELTLQGINCSIWRAAEPDVVIVGGLDKPALTVLTPDGVRAVHKVDQGSQITSGLCIDSYHQLINIDCTTVCCVLMDICSTLSSTLIPLTKLTVGKRPSYLFSITTFRFGVYYHSPCHIDIFTLRDILTSSTNPKPTRTITLEKHNANFIYSVCVDAEDNICIASYYEDTVHVHTQDGDHLRRIGNTRGKNDKIVRGGRLFNPRSLQCFKDGSMVIICDREDTHYVDNKGQWTLVKGEYRGLLDTIRNKDEDSYVGICTRSHIWYILLGQPISLFDVSVYMYNTT